MTKLDKRCKSVRQQLFTGREILLKLTALELLKQGLIAKHHSQPAERGKIRFTLPNGKECVAEYYPVQEGKEIMLRAWYSPFRDDNDLYNAMVLSDDIPELCAAYAYGWIEREYGFHLQKDISAQWHTTSETLEEILALSHHIDDASFTMTPP